MSVSGGTLGHGAMSGLDSFSDVNRKSDLGAIRPVDDPKADIFGFLKSALLPILDVYRGWLPAQSLFC